MGNEVGTADTLTYYAITLCIMILVASFLAGSLREEAFMVGRAGPVTSNVQQAV